MSDSDDRQKWLERERAKVPPGLVEQALERLAPLIVNEKTDQALRGDDGFRGAA